MGTTNSVGILYNTYNKKDLQALLILLTLLHLYF
jgi:hypothetical protein